MKIFYNSKIAKIFTFIPNFKTINLFGSVFTESNELSKETIEHEKVHSVQYNTLFKLGIAINLILLFLLFVCNICDLRLLFLIIVPIFLYYVWYVTEYIIRLFGNNFDNLKAYKNISFEREARDLCKEYLKPCLNRKYAYDFSFLKYLKNK